MTYNPEIVEGPAEQPAVDYLTGSAVGPFIDTGVYAEDRQTGRRYGRIYLSKDTVLSLAALLGGVPTPQEERTEYARGFLDGVKENIGGDLVRTSDALRRWLDLAVPVAGPEGDQ